MNSFLQTILIILLVYYGLKIIFKFLKPYLIKYIAKKASDRFGQSFGNNPFNNTSRKKRMWEQLVLINQMQIQKHPILKLVST